jgi:hypothetical protein
MKEALIAIKEKGIKSIDLLKLFERGIKLPIDEPFFPIQVHAISPTKVKEMVIPLVEVSSTDYSTEIVCHQNAYVYDIRAQLEENSHRINYLRKILSSNVDSIKAITKNCVMMNNKVKQMVFLQNKLYEQLISKEEHVCGVNTRGGSTTQDPDFPEGHPKRKEHDALKANKSSGGKSPNGNKIKEHGKDQEQDTFISDVETKDGNNNEEESSQVSEEQQDNEHIEENEADARNDLQPSKKKKEISTKKR